MRLRARRVNGKQSTAWAALPAGIMSRDSQKFVLSIWLSAFVQTPPPPPLDPLRSAQTIIPL